MTRLIRTLAIACCALLLAACAAGGARSDAGPAAGQSPQDYLPARAEARWKHLIDGNWEQAYRMLTPGYREVHGFDGYRQAMIDRKINWTAARVTGVECESDSRCSVKLTVEYAVIGGIPGVRDMSSVRANTETWLKLDGDWYFLPRA